MKVYGIVYLLIDGTNDRHYVGQTTKTLEERFKRHARSKKSLIGRTIRTHGADNFVSVILKECDSKKELDRWEKHFIKSYDSMSPNGYNFTEGGDGVVGYSPTAEVLAKIVASHTGKKHTPEITVKMAAANRSGSFYKNLLREIINHQKQVKENFGFILRFPFQKNAW